MGNAVIPRASMANQQPRRVNGQFAPVAVQISRRRGTNRLAGVVQRAPETRTAGQGIVKIEHQDDDRKRVILK